MIGWIIAALAAIVIFWGLLTYNGLVRRKNLVAEAWSGIEAQLKRRADLIPNLIETVKGYAAHERGTFDQLTKLRAQASANQSTGDMAARAQTEQQITAAIGKIMAVAEAYPDLKASKNFLQLQEQIAHLEEELSMARRYYNACVRDHNTYGQTLPASLLAGLAHFSPRPYFMADEGDKAAPGMAF